MHGKRPPSRYGVAQCQCLLLLHFGCRCLGATLPIALSNVRLHPPAPTCHAQCHRNACNDH